RDWSSDVCSSDLFLVRCRPGWLWPTSPIRALVWSTAVRSRFWPRTPPFLRHGTVNVVVGFLTRSAAPAPRCRSLPTDPTPADLARSRDRALVHALDPEPKAHALEQLHVGAKPRVHDVALDAADLGLVDAGGLGEPLLAHAQLLSLLGKLLAHAPVVAAERAQSPDVFGPAGLGPRLEPLHELVPRLGHVIIMGFMHGQVKAGYFWRWRCRACQSAKRFRAIWIWAFW